MKRPESHNKRLDPRSRQHFQSWKPHVLSLPFTAGDIWSRRVQKLVLISFRLLYAKSSSFWKHWLRSTFCCHRNHLEHYGYWCVWTFANLSFPSLGLSLLLCQHFNFFSVGFNAFEILVFSALISAVDPVLFFCFFFSNCQHFLLAEVLELF